MLRSLKDLERYTLSATDGEIGKVADFLVDDERWTVRYLVAETGGFFNARKVLISPVSFRLADWGSREFHVSLTREKVKNSPDVDTAKPVTRQHEQNFAGYYGYPYYWGATATWGIMGAYPYFLPVVPRNEAMNDVAVSSGDAHLRSASAVRGYHIHGTDDAIGHIDDFIVDDATWEIRYLVIDTSNWWFGKKVLVAPGWTTEVSWDDRSISMAMTRDAIKNSPEWNPTAGVNREYESQLYDYYGRPVYWGPGDRAAQPRNDPGSRHA